jgi:hypothetical protein
VREHGAMIDLAPWGSLEVEIGNIPLAENFVEDGLRRHPKVSELEVLTADIRREYLEGAIERPSDTDIRLEDPDLDF